MGNSLLRVSGAKSDVLWPGNDNRLVGEGGLVKRRCALAFIPASCCRTSDELGSRERSIFCMVTAPPPIVPAHMVKPSILE